MANDGEQGPVGDIPNRGEASCRYLQAMSRLRECSDFICQIDKKGKRVHPSEAKDGIPKMDDVTIPCGLYRERL
jgi:hypothetical protein